MQSRTQATVRMSLPTSVQCADFKDVPIGQPSALSGNFTRGQSPTRSPKDQPWEGAGLSGCRSLLGGFIISWVVLDAVKLALINHLQEKKNGGQLELRMLGMVAHACRFSIWKAEDYKFNASLVYKARTTQ